MTGRARRRERLFRVAAGVAASSAAVRALAAAATAPRDHRRPQPPPSNMLLVWFLFVSLLSPATTTCPTGAYQGFAQLKPLKKCNIPAVPMCVHPPTQDSIISGGIISTGGWKSKPDESWRRAVLCDIVRSSHPGSWVLDIGGNIGTFTLPLLAAGRNVVAVEAFPGNHRLLRASYNKLLGDGNTNGTLGRLHLIDQVVTAPGMPATVCIGHQHKKGKAELPVVKDNQGNMQVKAVSGQELCSSEVIKAGTIDEKLKTWKRSLRRPSRFAAVKVDIEGHEPQMIKGATKLFCRYRPPLVFFEGRLGTGGWLDRFANDFGYSLNATWSFSSDLNTKLADTPDINSAQAHDVRLSPVASSRAPPACVGPMSG